MAYWVHRISEVKGQYRITLPKPLVKDLGWDKGDVLILRKYGEDMVVVELGGKGVRFESDISECKFGAD